MRSFGDPTPVLTGLGAISALGFGVAATWDALCASRSGAAPTGDADVTSGMGLAALVEEPYLRVEVPDALQAHIKFLNGSGELAAEVAHEAWGATAWADQDVPPGRKGLWLSQMDAWDWSCTELRSAFVDATESFTEPLEAATLNQAAKRRTKPFYMLESIKNNAFSFVSAWHGLQGANTGVAGFTGGTLPLLDLAARAVRRGSLDRALLVATGRAASAVARRDAVMHGLSRPSDDAAFRPLDRHGQGVVLGEGAAAVGIERLADARSRGAAIQGALLGFGASTDAPLDGLPAPTTTTVRRAIRAALADAAVEAGDVQAVVLPALGLPEADTALLAALEGEAALEDAAVVSWRGATGLAGLAGELIDVVVATKALGEGRLPGTVGCRTPLGDRVALASEPWAGGGVLVVAAGLQGEASAQVIARA